MKSQIRTFSAKLTKILQIHKKPFFLSRKSIEALHVLTRVGQATFCPQIENPQFLGIILLSQIRQFLWLIRKSKSANFYKILHNSISEQFESKSRLFNDFLLFTNLNWSIAVYAIFVRRKSIFYLRT